MTKIIWTTEDLARNEQAAASLSQQISNKRSEFCLAKEFQHIGDEQRETYPETREIAALSSRLDIYKERIQEAYVFEAGSKKAKALGLGDRFTLTDQFGTELFTLCGSYSGEDLVTDDPNHSGVSFGSPIHDWYLKELNRLGKKPGHDEIIEIRPFTPKEGVSQLA